MGKTKDYDFDKLYDVLSGKDYEGNIKMLVGHLVIEVLLRELLLTKFPNLDIKGFKYEKLLRLSYGTNLINESQKIVLSKINDVRNDIAHDVYYKLESRNLLAIATQTESAFNELRTSLAGLASNHIDPEIKDVKDVSWTISLIFSQILHELTYIKLNVDPSSD